MDFFDRRISVVLKDGKPREFQQLLRDVGFSHSTLRGHLTRLERQGLVVKEKKPQKVPGRPRFTYHIPSRLKRQVILSLEDPYIRLVTLPFSRLKHLVDSRREDTARRSRADVSLKRAHTVY